MRTKQEDLLHTIRVLARLRLERDARVRVYSSLEEFRAVQKGSPAGSDIQIQKEKVSYETDISRERKAVK